MADGFSFSIPLKIQVSKNKHFVLNLNQYRNTHHRVLNNAKKNFTEAVMKMPLPAARYDKVRLHYKVYPKTKRKYDLMNVISVVDKFLCDALIKKGIIRDDNITHVAMPTAQPMAPDRDNPRIEVFVEDIGKNGPGKYLSRLEKLYS